MTDTDAPARLERAGAWALRLLLGLLAACIGYALATLPPASGLTRTVVEAMPRSGVEHPVTAVLMNFRGYDTLLETTVLLLSLLGIWSLRAMPDELIGSPGPVLNVLTQLLAPFLLLLAGYLLWAGTHEPGGAFQAGAILAAAGVLGTLAGHQWPLTLGERRLRLLLVLGPAVFAGIGAASIPLGRRFLQFPPDQAGILVLTIEATATVSIGLILLAAFRGAPAQTPEPER